MADEEKASTTSATPEEELDSINKDGVESEEKPMEEVEAVGGSVTVTVTPADDMKPADQPSFTEPVKETIKEEESDVDASSPNTSLEPVPSSEGKKKKEKPMSSSMQRLTAKKGESPLSSRKTSSAEECKARANDLRKKKILDSRQKEDERRAAVLERKKKLEDAENSRKEALFKKIAVESAAAPSKGSSTAIRKKYSVSTSNLSAIRKSRPADKEATNQESGGAKRSNQSHVSSTLNKSSLDRPKSSMARSRPSLSTSNLLKSKEKLDSKTRPATAEPSKKNPSRPPSSRQSLNPRPATAMGISGVDKRKSLPSGPSKVGVKTLDKTSVKPLKQKSETTSLPSKPASKLKSKSDSASPSSTKQKEVNKPKSKSDSTFPKSAPLKASENKTKPSSAAKPKATNTETKSKSTKTAITDKSSKHADGKAKAGMTEEEAKKALAERRRKAKEEAEAKAQAEREKDEEEQRKREEEERRMQEQMKEEEERQARMLEELRKEEEERAKRMGEEKERKEQEEKDRLEEEQKSRDEEIERKAKLELEKRQKEQDKLEQELDAEREERKKRVEMIMARVSSKRSGTGSESSSEPSDTKKPESPTSEKPATLEASPPGDSSARLKVDGILQRLGRSNENLLDVSKEEQDDTETEPATVEGSSEKKMGINTDDTTEVSSLNEPFVTTTTESIDVRDSNLTAGSDDALVNDTSPTTTDEAADKITETDLISTEINDDKIGNNNTLLITNGSIQCEDSEKEEWSELERRMKLDTNGKVGSPEESKLWKVMEGSVDISECF